MYSVDKRTSYFRELNKINEIRSKVTEYEFSSINSSRINADSSLSSDK